MEVEKVHFQFLFYINLILKIIGFNDDGAEEKAKSNG